MRQQDILLKHLKGKAITKLQALKMYGIWNTGNEILKLRRRGFNIITTMVPRSEGSPFASYSMKS